MGVVRNILIGEILNFLLSETKSAAVRTSEL